MEYKIFPHLFARKHIQFYATLEIPVVFRNADLGKKIPGNAEIILARTLGTGPSAFQSLGQSPEHGGE